MSEQSAASDQGPAMTTAWLIGVARHKLVDHWRKKARDQRNLQAVADEVAGEVDPWDAHLDASVAHAVLGRLPGVTLYYRVTNMAAAVAKVRELGGTVVSEDTYGSGGNASCLDDQGVPFQLWRPAPGY